jgi:peptidoglycan hydrolase CwlO-like protein
VPPGTWFADPNAEYKDYRRQLSAQIKKDHRLSDMERHLKEAKAFVEEHRVQIEKDRRNLEEQKAKQKEKYRSEK